MGLANSHKIPRISCYSGQRISNMSSPNKILLLCIPHAPPLAGLSIPFEFILLNTLPHFYYPSSQFHKKQKRSHKMLCRWLQNKEEKDERQRLELPEGFSGPSIVSKPYRWSDSMSTFQNWFLFYFTPESQSTFR